MVVTMVYIHNWGGTTIVLSGAPSEPQGPPQDQVGEWICLRFRRSALLRLGIITKDEQVGWLTAVP